MTAIQYICRIVGAILIVTALLVVINRESASDGINDAVRRPAIEGIDTASVISALSNGNCYIIDNRPSIYFSKGHIPNAVSAHAIDPLDLYKQAMHATTIIVYGDSDDILNTMQKADTLSSQLKRRVFYYTGSMMDWRKVTNTLSN